QHNALAPHWRDTCTVHRGAVGHGTHLEPDDLRPRDQEQPRLRCRHPREDRGGALRGGPLLRARPRGPDPRRRSLPADPREDERCRRLGLARGLNPHVGSVASIFVSRWDSAVTNRVPTELNGRLGIAMARRTYKAYRDLLASDRWLRLLNVGARSQRLLWASTGTKDPKASDVLYVKSLAAPHSVNTMPEKTLLALADHGEIGAMLPHDGGDAEEILDRFAKAGVDVNALAAELQRDGAAAFVASWKELLACLVDKSQTLK